MPEPGQPGRCVFHIRYSPQALAIKQFEGARDIPDPASLLSRSEERLLRALLQRKGREEQGLFLAEGVRTVEELAASGFDLRLAVASTTLEDTPRGAALQSTLASRAPVRVLPEHVLRTFAATENPQGVLAVARIPRAVLQDVRLKEPSRVLICDAVQDPGNLGTLIRIADAFAASAVILLPGTVDPWNPKVVRAAAGSSFHVPLIPAEMAELSTWLREHRFRTLGAAADGAPFQREPVSQHVALVVGNEGAGLRAETQPLLDAVVRIDMPGNAESLNVGVAAGILLYLLSRSDA